MKNKKVKIIVGIMICALVGIAIIQSYAIFNENKKFNFIYGVVAPCIYGKNNISV